MATPGRQLSQEERKTIRRVIVLLIAGAALAAVTGPYTSIDTDGFVAASIGAVAAAAAALAKLPPAARIILAGLALACGLTAVLIFSSILQ